MSLASIRRFSTTGRSVRSSCYRPARWLSEPMQLPISRSPTSRGCWHSVRAVPSLTRSKHWPASPTCCVSMVAGESTTDRPGWRRISALFSTHRASGSPRICSVGRRKRRSTDRPLAGARQSRPMTRLTVLPARSSATPTSHGSMSRRAAI